jgi:hypothetical protein
VFAGSGKGSSPNVSTNGRLFSHQPVTAIGTITAGTATRKARVFPAHRSSLAMLFGALGACSDRKLLRS